MDRYSTFTDQTKAVPTLPRGWDVPGVTTEVALGDGHRADVVVRAGGVRHVIEVKAQAAINVANAHQLIKFAEGLPEKSTC